jgi:hypothetical protein
MEASGETQGPTARGATHLKATGLVHGAQEILEGATVRARSDSMCGSQHPPFYAVSAVSLGLAFMVV